MTLPTSHTASLPTPQFLAAPKAIAFLKLLGVKDERIDKINLIHHYLVCKEPAWLSFAGMPVGKFANRSGDYFQVFDRQWLDLYFIDRLVGGLNFSRLLWSNDAQ